MNTEQTKLIARTRKLNTTASGNEFDQVAIDLVWLKGADDWGFLYFRRDIYGAPIAKQDFGKKSKYGWEIDHIIPVSQGGTDDLTNLQPLQWMNNRKKGDEQPQKSGDFEKEDKAM